MFSKVIQSNVRFGLTGRLEVHLDHVRMPAGNGRQKKKGRCLDVMSAIKKIIVVKAGFLCSAHALIIVIFRVNGDPNYALYRQGKCINKPAEDLLKASGVDLSNGGSFEEF
jgi:hypothetical protein